MKKVLCLVLAAIMVLSMVACGGNGGNTTTKAAEGTTKAATTTKAAEATTKAAEGTTAAPTEGTAEAPTEPVDLAWEKYDEVVEIKMAHMLQAGVVYPEGMTQEDNAWTRYALEKFNIKMVDAWSAESDYYDKIQLAMMKPDDPEAGLPDIFTCTSVQLKQMVEYGLVADLTDVFEDYASDTLKRLEYADEVAFKAAEYDGKIYGLSTLHYGYISNICMIWVRQDWLDNLGLEQPKTWDDLYNVCKAFTENDPDGNGQNDTVGFCLYKDFGYFNSVFAGFNAWPNIWVKDGSETVWGGIQPEVKDCLAWFQKLYADGYVNKEFATLNKSGMKEYVEQGKAGVCLYTGSFGYSIGMNAYANNDKAMFYCMEIPSATNETVIHGFGLSGGTFNCANANCKHPEALVKLCNIYAWVFNDLNDETIKNQFNYTYGNPGPIGVNNPLADYQQTIDIVAVEKGKKDASELQADAKSKYEVLLKWTVDHNYEGLSSYYQVSKDGSLNKVKHVIENNEYIISEYHNVPGEEYTKYMSTLSAMQEETYVKIIMGESLDTFDTFVETWKKSGGDSVTAEMNGK